MVKKNKRLVIPNCSAALDLTKGLREKFEIITETPEECANLFFKNNAEFALISPFEYAKRSGFLDLQIYPHASLSLTEASRDSILLLSKGHENITNIAYRKGFVYETYLAKILFSENYKTNPSFKVSDDDVKKTLEKFDSVLLSGDEGIENSEGKIAGLLLAEEWFLLTGLPYVNYLLISRAEDVTPENTAIIKDNFSFKPQDEDEDGAGEDGLLTAIMNTDDDFDDDFAEEESNYTFEFGDEQKASIEEYFNFLFSYSLIENIPDINIVE
jgi:predicted solute-binding protein